MKRVLITGAAGQIGNALRNGLRGGYPLIRLLDIAPLGAREEGEELLNRYAAEPGRSARAPPRASHSPSLRGSHSEMAGR